MNRVDAEWTAEALNRTKYRREEGCYWFAMNMGAVWAVCYSIDGGKAELWIQ